MKTLAEYLDLAAATHGHLCTGQALGVRLAMLGLGELGFDPLAEPKRLVTYVEIDRWVTDAVALVANCRLGKRALKFRDWGKVAATFVDLKTGRAVRIIRELGVAFLLTGFLVEFGELVADGLLGRFPGAGS